MNFILVESLRSAFAAIRANGLRSFLTALGIIIGVAAVIAVVSIVQGLSYTVNAQFQGLGADSITIRSYTPVDLQLSGRFARLTEADLRAVQHRVDGITDVTPILFDPAGKTGQIGYRAKNHFVQVSGVGSSYMDVVGVFPERGRFFSRDDEQRRRLVCLVGQEAARAIELPEDPVGQFIRIGDDWCRVIGVMEARGELFGFSQDDFVLLPYETMRRIIGTSRQHDLQIQLTITDMAQLDEVSSRIRRVLRQARDLKPGDPDDFKIQTPQQLTESFNAIVDTITAVAGGVVGISLLVGGIGIMNIMLVSVTERTREIGILKSLGASKWWIAWVFEKEALAISLLGVAGGLLVAVLARFALVHGLGWKIELEADAILSSALAGIVSGLLGALYPALRAASQDPVDALSYE